MMAGKTMILFKQDSTGTEYKGFLSSLRDAAKNSNLDVGIFSTEAEIEIDEIIGFMKIASELGIPPNRITLITPHPTLDSLRKAAANNFTKLIVSSNPSSTNTEDVFNINEILPTTCSFLHFNKSENVPLSVCGAHNDRMVLAPHHMSRWCLTGYKECPHYRMKQDD